MGMLLTTRDVARLLRVHPKHVYRLLKRGLPARRVGDEWRFDEREVMAWSAAQHPHDQTRPGETAPLVAANGDVAVELLLSGLQGDGVIFGFVTTDHRGALELLERRTVA